MPQKGLKSLTHSGEDYTTRKGSKFYVRSGKEVRPYRQKKGGATINKQLLIKLLGGMIKRKPVRRGGNPFAGPPGFTHTGFY